MPRFFFDCRDDQGRLERDDEGIVFPSLEAAYKDALQAAADMRTDACFESRNIADHRFEIRDEDGEVRRVLPFTRAKSKKP